MRSSGQSYSWLTIRVNSNLLSKAFASHSVREKAMPLLGRDSTRGLDHLFSGPDLPVNKNVRARLFGE